MAAPARGRGRPPKAKDSASLLSDLNAALDGTTPYRLALVDPAEIASVDNNAHFMTKRVFEQLVANIRTDGNLGSVPFCHLEGGTYTCLSGNHRVEAARQAGVERVLVLYTDEPLSEGKRRAIQLSHNALVGQDDPLKLRDLYQRITDLSLQMYSGLDDNVLATLKPIDVSRLVEAPLRLEEIPLTFMPQEADRLEDLIKRLGKPRRRWAAPLEQWERFFELLLSFKEARGIVNTATAVFAMCEIVEAWLKEHEDDPDVQA